MSDSGDARPRRAANFDDDDTGAQVSHPFEGLYRPTSRSHEAPADNGTWRHQDSPARAAEPTWQNDAIAASVEATPAESADDTSMRRSILLTLSSAVIPGVGLLGARTIGPKILGAVTSLAFVVGLGYIAWQGVTNTAEFLGFAVDNSMLLTITYAAVFLAVVWVALIMGTQLVTRPQGTRGLRRFSGAIAVTVFSAMVATPMAVGARYSFDQAQLVTSVFGDDDVTSTTVPTLAAEDPWADIPRLNVLLLGGDDSSSRDYGLEEIRTDTIMVASINTQTGDTTLIQIPRNLQYTPFPEGSEMDAIYPNGFTSGVADDAEFFINALWEQVELNQPTAFEGSTYRGAEAVKQGAEGITGLKIDYFALLNIDGLSNLIDAMGGVTVNINQRLPIGGDSSGRRPDGYLEPGPDQHLNGFDAMWYARSRSSTDDYSRMARQSCLVSAIIKQANPQTLLTNYEAIAGASENLVVTDIPEDVLKPLVELAFKVKDGEISRLVFSPGKNGYSYGYPDFEEMQEAVADAIEPEDATSSSSPEATTSKPTESTSSEPADPASEPEESPSATSTGLVEGTQDVTDACAYNPV